MSNHTPYPYLNAISENATRFGMRLQETISERTRELGGGIAGFTGAGSGAAYLEGAGGDEKANATLKKHLEGSSDREKLDAMKRLVAFISKNRNVSSFFPSVVKNVASPNLEIRKLVYIYLLRYAEQEPDLALLSINTFQRDLADSNPLIRAMALRVLSGIKVGMVGGVVVLAIKKCANDASPYVRKAAALAIPKCYELDATHLPALLQIISQTLLHDRSPLSLGAVAFTFNTLFPSPAAQQLELLHPHFRRLCKILVDVDEWGQVEMMRLLTRYVRCMCMRTREGDVGVEDGKEVEEGEELDKELDKDVKLLADSVLPVLQSRNPAVVMAAARVLFTCAPKRYWREFVRPMLRLLTVSKEVERIVLVDLLVVCRTTPNLFAPYYTRFLVRGDDLSVTKKDKIKLLLVVLDAENYAAILRELIDYADDTDDGVVAEAIEGVGRCAERIPESISQCLTALIRMIKSRYDSVVSSAVMVLKRLVQVQLSFAGQVSVTGADTAGQSPLAIIGHLARRIDDIKHSQARACVVWLVGQYAGEGASAVPASVAYPTAPEGIAEWAPDVLRKLAKSFAEEDLLVKLQVVTLAAKLFVLSSAGDARMKMLVRYVFSLARYDVNYDVRDRGRMLWALLAGVGLVDEDVAESRGGVVLRREQVKLVLFEGKVKSEEKKEVVSGRFAGIMEEELADWLERGVESSLRDSPDDAVTAPAGPVVTAISSANVNSVMKGVPTPPIVLTPTGAGTATPSGGTGTKGPWTDLDAFYADDKEKSEESEEEEEEDEEEEEESGEDDESEESESENSDGNGASESNSESGSAGQTDDVTGPQIISTETATI